MLVLSGVIVIWCFACGFEGPMEIGASNPSCLSRLSRPSNQAFHRRLYSLTDPARPAIPGYPHGMLET